MPTHMQGLSEALARGVESRNGLGTEKQAAALDADAQAPPVDTDAQVASLLAALADGLHALSLNGSPAAPAAPSGTDPPTAPGAPSPATPGL